MRLVLFDIDGTLITTAHAGMRAYYRALHAVFNIKVDGELIHPDGKTDPLIARELLAHFGMEDQLCDKSRQALFSSYLTCLEEEMSRAKECGSIRILPGVVSLLESLSRQSDFALGLVTGNLEKGAQIKLENAGLRKHFRFGGYGSDSEDRTDLTRIGIRRGIEFVAPSPVESAFIVGDTPLDVIHGHAAGAFVIAVASARYSLDNLQPHQPDLLVPNLMPSEEIISFMRGRSWAKVL
jgi:phosphoglycolate phosphatase-like HAD superfamily hydrolase